MKNYETMRISKHSFKKCTTVILINEGHNLTTEGIPKDESIGCDLCNDVTCCHYIGEICGCDSPICVDYINKRRGRVR